MSNESTTSGVCIRLVDRAKANDFTAIKFYGTFDPTRSDVTLKKVGKSAAALMEQSG